MRPQGLRSSKCSKLIFGNIIVAIGTNLIFENDPFPKQKGLSFQKESQKRKMVIKIKSTPVPCLQNVSL